MQWHHTLRNLKNKFAQLNQKTRSSSRKLRFSPAVIVALEKNFWPFHKYFFVKSSWVGCQLACLAGLAWPQLDSGVSRYSRGTCGRRAAARRRAAASKSKAAGWRVGGRVASASLSSLNIQQQLTTQFYTDPLIIKLVQTHSLEVMICN